MDPPRNACFDRTTRIHCLCKACVSGSCLYCDHDQSIKAQRGYWQGACSSVSFTLPLFVCVCVCFCESQTKPLSPCTSSIPLCVCKHLLSLSVSLSASNQCLIGLIPETMDELFLEIPVMKRLSTPPPPYLFMSQQLHPLFEPTSVRG